MSASTPEIQRLVSRIRGFCEANSDPKLIAKYGKYFREGYDAYGVSGELKSEESGKILSEYRDYLGFSGFLDLGDTLMASGKYEEAFFAIGFVVSFKEEFSRNTLDRIGNWFDGKVVNWAVSDSLCGDVLSPLLAQSIVSLEDFDSWRTAANRFKRRAVPVTMLILLKSEFECGRLLEFIRPMMTDDERVVHQGLGWFLRELWKKSPAETERFLLQWKDTAARLIFQYATEKMTAEQKGRFRRTKS